MVRVFLDTNYFIDAIHRRPEKQILKSLIGNIVFTSALSFHIYCYSFKIKIPDKTVIAQKEEFQIVEFSENILNQSLLGPTSDFEDNVQLHSAANADCDIFLTGDKKLLSLHFFGKTKVLDSLS